MIVKNSVRLEYESHQGGLEWNTIKKQTTS